jgi:hypothetical protein
MALYYGSNNAVSILVNIHTTLFNSSLILPNIVTFPVFSQIIVPNHNNSPHTEIKIMTKTQDGPKYRPTCPLQLSKPTRQLLASNHTLLPQDRRADILNYFVRNTTDATVTVWIMTTNAPIFSSSSMFLLLLYFRSCPLSCSDFGISEIDLKAYLQIRESVSALYSTHSPFKRILYVQVFFLSQYGHHNSDSRNLHFCTSVLCHTNYKQAYIIGIHVVIQETHEGRGMFRDCHRWEWWDNNIWGIFMLLHVGFTSQKLEHKVKSTRKFKNQRCLGHYLPIILELPF